MKNSVNKSPLVSVCVPVYNAEKYLRECIDSILAQTFTDFELLIVDDGSTDSSCKIIESYSDKRITLYTLDHNYINTCNFLLKEARGKYIARMDSDDIMHPKRLEIEYIYLEEHKDISIVGSNMNIIGKEAIDFSDQREYEVTLDMLSVDCIIAHPTIMMRKKDIKEKGLYYDREYIYADDYNYWVSAILKGLRIINLPEPLNNYRLSDTQISKTYAETQRQNAIKIKKRIIRAIKPSPFSIIKKDNNVKIKPPIKGNKMTTIIPFLNEGNEVLNTIESIRSSVGDNVEIIVINDCSNDEFDYSSAVSKFRVSYIVNKQRKGVAACRDLGISLCKTPYFLLLDAHMRFYDNKWHKRLSSLLDEDDRVLLCCQTRFLHKNKHGRVVINKNCSKTYGAITAFRDGALWPDIEWNYYEENPNCCIEPIANVLGAGYAASKKYWSYIEGLKGLQYYGCDEAFISFKVWREGGRCLLIKDLTIGHIYRSSAPYKHYMEEEICNELIVSYLTFSQSWCCRTFAKAYYKEHDLYLRVTNYLSAYRNEIEVEKKYLNSIYTHSFEDVLKLHINKIKCRTNTSEIKFTLAKVNNYILNNPVRHSGLYDGKMGQLLWFCHYYNYFNNPEANDKAQKLWKDIQEDLNKESLSWTFAQGVSGIGWALIHLYTNNLIGRYPSKTLNKIDKTIECINLDKIPTKQISDGIGGILAYVVARLKTGKPQFETSMNKKLEQISWSIINMNNSDMPSIYYAMFYLEILKNGITKEDYRPCIGEWLKIGQHLPSNTEYWKPILFDGCIGAMIRFISN